MKRLGHQRQRTESDSACRKGSEQGAVRVVDGWLTSPARTHGKSPAKSYASMQRDSKGPFDDIYKLVGETIEALGALGKK